MPGIMILADCVGILAFLSILSGAQVQWHRRRAAVSDLLISPQLTGTYRNKLAHKCLTRALANAV